MKSIWCLSLDSTYGELYQFFIWKKILE